MQADYAVSQKVIHWLMASMIMLDLFIAQKFGGEMELWDRLDSRGDHATMGTIVATLFVLRLALRFKHGAPPLPSGMSPVLSRLAHIAHFLMYFFIGFLILSGIVTAINATSPIEIFGAFDFTAGQVDESTFDFLRGFHEIATNAVIALIALHIVAALYHQFIARDDSMIKMLKFWKSAD